MKELIVYPTPYGVRQHRLLQLRDKKGVTGEYPVTFEIFIQKCIEKSTASMTFLGDFKKNLIIEEIFKKLLNSLHYFNTFREGYGQRVGEIIGELKRQDIQPNEFKDLVKDIPSHQDIYMIYNTYQDFLQQNNLFDQEDRYIICKNCISSGAFVYHYDKVHFRDFYKLSPIQKKIIEALGPKAQVTNSKLIRKMKDITVARAQDRRTEVYLLAHTIIEDLNSGLLPEDICIVLRRRDMYESLLSEIFEEADIPLRLEKGTALLQNPFIKSLLAFFRGGKSSYFPEVISWEISPRQRIGFWAKKLKEFLEDKGFPENLCQLHHGNLRLLKRDLEALKVLDNLLMELYDMDTIISWETMDLRCFISQLELYLKKLSYNYSFPSDGIWVLSPAMLRGLSFEKTYTLGLVAGEYPRDFRPDWLLKEEEREKLNSRGYELDTIDLLLEREAESFEFLLASSKRGYFSCPRLLENNSASLISSYLEDLIDENDNYKKVTADFSSVFCYEDKEEDSSNECILLKRDIERKIKEKFKKTPFSVTALNTYGECPYKFFLSRVLKLSERESDEEFAALDKGNIIHEVLEKFFKSHCHKLSEDDLEGYREEIKARLESILERENIQDKFPHPRLFDIEKSEIMENLMAYIEYHIKNQGDFIPCQLELEFGFDRDFFLDFSPDILLQGKIDRIDMDPSGNLVVFDYKNNWTPDINDVEAGTNLQMPVYIMAAEKLLGRPVLGGGFISIKKGKIDSVIVRERNLPFISKRRRKGILSLEEWDALMENTRYMIKTYTENIRKSSFPQEPKKCPKVDRYGSFCDFIEVCSFEGEE